MMMIKQIVYLFFLILINSIQRIHTKSEPDYYQYLQQFGYTPKLQGRRVSSSHNEEELLASPKGQPSFSEGIKTFQRLYKLPVSYSI